MCCVTWENATVPPVMLPIILAKKFTQFDKKNQNSIGVGCMNKSLFVKFENIIGMDKRCPLKFSKMLSTRSHYPLMFSLFLDILRIFTSCLRASTY
jgi:hypothetical protein